MFSQALASTAHGRVGGALGLDFVVACEANATARDRMHISGARWKRRKAC